MASRFNINVQQSKIQGTVDRKDSIKIQSINWLKRSKNLISFSLIFDSVVRFTAKKQLTELNNLLVSFYIFLRVLKHILFGSSFNFNSVFYFSILKYIASNTSIHSNVFFNFTLTKYVSALNSITFNSLFSIEVLSSNSEIVLSSGSTNKILLSSGSTNKIKLH